MRIVIISGRFKRLRTKELGRRLSEHVDQAAELPKENRFPMLLKRTQKVSHSLPPPVLLTASSQAPGDR